MGTFSQNAETSIFDTLIRFRQVEGVRFGNFFETFSKTPFGRAPETDFEVSSGSAGEPFGVQKSIFFEVRF